jgi:hypothetical protein
MSNMLHCSPATIFIGKRGFDRYGFITIFAQSGDSFFFCQNSNGASLFINISLSTVSARLFAAFVRLLPLSKILANDCANVSF